MALKYSLNLFIILIFFSCQERTQEQQEKVKARPNFLFILVDDLGWTDIGAFGSTFYETPNVDKLAATGMKFTQGYAASPVCSPTRSSILTGKNPARTLHTQFFGGPQPGQNVEGYWMWAGYHRKLEPPVFPEFLDHKETTLAEAFKEAGYTTFFAGKWHLGGEEHFPEKQGFDINKGGINRGGPYGGKKYFSPYGNDRLTDGPDGEHLPDRLATETAKFIEDNKDTSFIAYLSFYSVHTPLMARPDLEEKYIKRRDSLGLRDDFEPWGHRDLEIVKTNQSNPVYAGMVEAMDLAVGKVLNKLEELGLTENTVVIFMSDNGGLSTYEMATSNLPLRAGKAWGYEGGIRVPLIVKWPGVIEENSASNVPVISTDFYPTMLEMAGLPLKPQQHVDGTSFLPILKGEASSHETLLAWHCPHYTLLGETPFTAYRKGDWKLIYHYETEKYELYNIKEDIGETTDLALEKTEKVDELKKLMQEWLDESKTHFPTPNPRYEGEKG